MKTVKHLSLMLLVALFMANVGYAQEIKGCYNKRTGALRIANKCKTGELPITWNIQGPKGDPGIQGPEGAPGYSGPMVYDANNQTLGILVDYPNVFFLPSVGKFIDLKDLIVPKTDMWFQDTQCSGTPYFPASAAGPFALNHFVYNHNGSYFTPANGLSKNIASIRIVDNCSPTSFTCTIICRHLYCPQINPCVPVDDLIPLDKSCLGELVIWENHPVNVAEQVTLPFTEPISLPLSFK